MTALNQLVQPWMFRIYSSEYEDELVLEVPYYLIRVQGMGIPQTRYSIVSSPWQDGVTLLEDDSTLKPRVFSVSLVLRDLWRGISNSVGFRGSRIELARLFNPKLGGLKFEVVFTNGDVFYLDNVVVDTLFDATYGSAGDKGKDRITIRCIANYPVWYGDEHTVDKYPSDGNNFVLPEWKYNFIAENYGTWISWPAIRLFGPMTTPEVAIVRYDLDTASYLPVATIALNANIATGHYVNIITFPLEDRGVYDALGVDVSIETSSFFSAMSLAFDPIRKLHDNQTDANWYNNFIQIASYGCTNASRITAVYNDMWLGI